MGFDFGGDPEELKRDGASVSDKIPGVKMYGASIIAQCMMNAETHAGFWAMKAGYPEVVDPLKPDEEAKPAEEAKPDEEAKPAEEAPAAAEE